MIQREEFEQQVTGALHAPEPDAAILTLCIQRCIRGTGPDASEMVAAMRVLMSGTAPPALVKAFLQTFRAEIANAYQIAAAAAVLRHYAAPVVLAEADRPVCDTCGTGGDRSGTFNVSTAAALVLAAAGVRVAKHGNRSVTSHCGSADVLEHLGLPIDGDGQFVVRCIHTVGIGFLFAPRFHAATRHVMPARKELAAAGIRTVFNVLGPLANPAQPEYQVVGVYDPAILSVMAEALGLLGCRRALVVHGSDRKGAALDEISLCGPTQCALLDNGHVEAMTLTPERLGMAPASLEALSGGDLDESAVILAAILAGDAQGRRADAAALAAGAGLWVCGHADTLKAGIEQASSILSSGQAMEVVERWKQVR